MNYPCSISYLAHTHLLQPYKPPLIYMDIFQESSNILEYKNSIINFLESTSLADTPHKKRKPTDTFIQRMKGKRGAHPSYSGVKQQEEEDLFLEIWLYGKTSTLLQLLSITMA